jgi:hypothetical protein
MSSIVEQAAVALSRQLATLPEVTGVEGITPGMILVTTSLSDGQKLSVVPEEFATFPVHQYGVGERKKAYMGRLEFVLWAAVINQAQMDDTLGSFEAALRRIHTPLYADTPDKWIAEALAFAVREDDLAGGPLVDLISDLRRALADHRSDADFARGDLQSAPTSSLHTALQEVFSRHRVCATQSKKGAQSHSNHG